MADAVTFKLDIFEGPLDLLLHLVSKSKVSIYDVRISSIVDQYLQYMDALREFDAEVTSEFVAMAARLLYIKSRELLPKYEDLPEDDSEEKLRQDLIEYLKFKGVGDYFRERSELGRDIYIKQPEPLTRDKTYNYDHSTDDLFRALHQMLERCQRRLPPPVDSFSGIVGREPVSIESKTAEILTRLTKSGKISFGSLFERISSRSEAVAIFLALLDLCKDRRIFVAEQNDDYIISTGNGENND